MSSDETVSLELERAQALCDLRRFDEAGLRLHELLGRDPDNPGAWSLLAQAQLGLGRPEEALDAANHAAARAPEWEWPHRLRSLALQQLGDKNGAVEAAREAVRTGPYTWQTYARLAVTLSFARPVPAEALDIAERGVALAPSEPDTHFALGFVLNARRQHKEAEQHFRRALELDPQHGPSHNALASRKLLSSRFGRAGNLADAAAGFRTVVQTDPHADYGARHLELVIRLFVARLSYLIYVVAYLSLQSEAGHQQGARIGALLLLALPVAFAARFLARLESDLRRHVVYVAFHGELAVASIAQTSAITLLLVSAATPGWPHSGLGIAAIVISLLARLALARRRGKDLFFSAGSRWILLAVIASTILFFIGATGLGSFSPARGVFFVVAGAVVAMVGYRIIRLRA